MKLSVKVKQVLTWFFLIFCVLFFVLLITYKDKLTSYTSKLIVSQNNKVLSKTESAYIDSAFNYTKNMQPFQITFLEFGVKGCSACKSMEGVMDEIRYKYRNEIKVVFVNVLLPENHDLMKFYGVATIPMQILLDKTGKEFYRHSGYISAEDLIKSLIRKHALYKKRKFEYRKILALNL